MNKTSKINIALCLLMAMVGVFTSCSNDVEVDDNLTNSKVTICFTVSGRTSTTMATSSTRSVATRADEPEEGERTEAGDANAKLNENKIECLDLYLLDASGNLVKHVSSTANDLNYSTTADSNRKCVGTWKNLGLTWSDFKGRTVYLVANWTADVAGLTAEKLATEKADISTLFSNVAEMIDPYSTTHQTQELFLMDGSVKNISESDLVAGSSSNEKIFNIDIARAMAKIRISIKDANDVDITFGGNVDYQLVNYAKQGLVFADNSLEYAKQVVTYDYPLDDHEMKELNKTNVVVDGSKAAFYSYPNYWYNDSTNIHVKEPIDYDEDGKPKRQTYILLYAPFTENGETNKYYYKVPVNYRLQQDNDKVGATVDESLYQLKRNHIYNISVKIDRKGGTKEQPVILINDWVDDKTTYIDWENEFK